jgi:hypothetical protein
MYSISTLHWALSHLECRQERVPKGLSTLDTWGKYWPLQWPDQWPYRGPNAAGEIALDLWLRHEAEGSKLKTV